MLAVKSLDNLLLIMDHLEQHRVQIRRLSQIGYISEHIVSVLDRLLDLAL
jgi:hypothetical protein